MAPKRSRKGAKNEQKTNRNKDQLLKTVFERLRHHFAPFWEPSEPRKWCWRVGLVTFFKFFVFSFSEATCAEFCSIWAPFLKPQSIQKQAEIKKVGSYFIHLKKTKKENKLVFNNGYLPLPPKVIKSYKLSLL